MHERLRFGCSKGTRWCFFAGDSVSPARRAQPLPQLPAPLVPLVGTNGVDGHVTSFVHGDAHQLFGVESKCRCNAVRSNRGIYRSGDPEIVKKRQRVDDNCRVLCPEIGRCHDVNPGWG